MLSKGSVFLLRVSLSAVPGRGGSCAPSLWLLTVACNVGIRLVLDASEFERPKNECRLRMLRSLEGSALGALQVVSEHGDDDVHWPGVEASFSIDNVESERSRWVEPILLTVFEVGIIVVGSMPLRALRANGAVQQNTFEVSGRRAGPPLR